MVELGAAADVIVVGAGAAGLTAAAAAAARGRRTLLLEKSPRPGLKILISGGGRCNVTTTRSGSDLEAQFGAVRGRFLRHALRAFPPAEVRAWIEALGVQLREEDLEKLFPVSQRARDVLDALLAHARSCGVELRTGMPVQSIQRGPHGFVLGTPAGPLRAARVIVATGGLSYPKTGTTGDGYAFCRGLGHTITRTVPALAPLRVEAPWLRELQGIVVDGADLSVLDAAGEVVRTRRRPILCTHKGLSGPAPMDLAGDVEELGGALLRFDFAPASPREQVEQEWLQQAPALGRKPAAALLPRPLPERLRLALCRLAGVDAVTVAGLPRAGRQRLLAVLKDLRLPVASSLGFDHAEVTRGGVALPEIDARTMESKLVPGLFVCGELLDVDGPIGGFNFQAAFATGRLAGQSA